jgi:hypothetical protein
MVNYQLGKIYKIVCNKTGLIYVGSTCEPTLARRLAKHKADYNYYLKGNRGYITSFKILDNGDSDIVLLENCPCENKDELHKRERYYIENLECVNKRIECNTSKEYREAHKDKINEQNRKYIKNHKDIILQKMKVYREAHREELNKRNRDYREANREEINQRKRELRALKKQQQTDI